MSHESDRTPDHGWIDPDGSRVLAETLTAMAQGVDPYSPSGPAATLGRMAGRVRRRRTAKLGAAGGSALAVAGVLAFGATQFAPLHDASPVLPADPSTSAPAEPEPTVPAPELALDEGYQPDLLAGTSLACGVPWSEVVVADDARLVHGDDIRTTAVIGEDGEWSYSQSVPTRVFDPEGGELPADGLNWPTLVWTDAGGTVVDIGGWSPFPFTNTENLSGVTEASSVAPNECAPEGASGELPDGTYEVRAMTIRDADGELIAGPPERMEIVDGERTVAGGAGGVEVSEPIDLPEGPDDEIVAQRGINSVVLDRTGERERRVSYLGDLGAAERLATEGTAFEVRSRCTATATEPESGDYFALVTLRGTWAVPPGAEPLTIRCDGEEHVDLASLEYTGEAFSVDGEVGIELEGVDPTVAQVEVRLVPSAG
ncbi:hypothetical protein [Myceligenerans xiligouense]|uniref:Uncharacterized protein n=1 Tax=Myceligenerans xiligouense TaxID=253184 RepID=A0A3N4ZU77_9MICO|nr:hypothetical protein [Myceligenerans xiligouense]RPF23311.1 hypothetical protein EDD34_3996 [Myceligenerans xiligouense]